MFKQIVYAHVVFGSLLSVVTCYAESVNSNPFFVGEEIKSLTSPHVDSDFFELTNRQATKYLRKRSASPQTSEPPEKLTFYPMAGRLFEDLWINNFVDLDNGPGILDFACRNFTYDGHDATDTSTRTFAEQVIGVPIFAALDGTVVQAVDGREDMNVCPQSPCSSSANFVILEHAGQRRTYYWHLKKNSVAVSVGRKVKAGEQIGLVGSSGNSSQPHLHFAVYDDNGKTLVEPFSGQCNQGDSEWNTQPVVRYETYMRDFGITYEDFSSYQGYPHPFPNSGQLALTDKHFNYWFIVHNLPANSQIRTQFQRPDGSIAYDSDNQPFKNAESLRRSWWWRSYDINDLHKIEGEWRLLLDINGQRLVNAPFVVNSFRTRNFNHAPEPISIFIEPASPAIDDVIFCKVDADLVLDDLDYDLVRYHYQWTVDGIPVRDVVSAAQSDAIAHHIVNSGSQLSCSVTPSDGKTDGTKVTVSTTILAASPVAPETPTDQIDSLVTVKSPRALSGLWYDPAVVGEGLNLIYTEGGLLAYFYGYDNSGHPTWLISSNLYNQTIYFERAIIFEMLQSGAGTFDQPSPPANLDNWGTLQISFDKSCQTAAATLIGNDGEKRMQLVQLAGIQGINCKNNE